MQFTITGKELQEPINRISNLLKKKKSLPILNSLLFDVTNDDIKIQTTDLEIGLTAKLEGEIQKPGIACAGGELLIDTLKVMDPKETYNVSTTSTNSINITTNTTTHNIIGFEVDEYPQLPKYEGEKYNCFISKGQLAFLIDKTAYAMSKKDIQYMLHALHWTVDINQITTTAVDGVILALANIRYDDTQQAKLFEQAQNIQQPTVNTDFLMPFNAVYELKRVFKDSKEIRFVLDDGIIFITDGKYTLNCREIEIQDKNVTIPQQMVPDFVKDAQSGNSLYLTKSDVRKAITLAKPVLKKKNVPGITLDISSEKVVFSAKQVDKGKMSHTVDVLDMHNVSEKTEEYKVSFDVYLLEGILKTLDSEYIKIVYGNDAKSGIPTLFYPCNLEDKSISYLAGLMCLRDDYM